MFRQDRQSSSRHAFTDPSTGYTPHPSNYPSVDAQGPRRDYGPHPPSCPPRTYPTHIGPLALSSSSVPRALAKITPLAAYRIMAGQRVQVRLDGHGWAMGFTLSCLMFFEKISGYGCEVSYELAPGGPLGEGIFPEADIHPQDVQQAQ